MDESFDPTRESLNPYAETPQSGSGLVDFLGNALGVAKDWWNWQPFGASPPSPAPQSLNAYQGSAPSPVEPRRDPFLEMLYPSLLSEQATTGYTSPPMTGMERLKTAADLVGQATPFEAAAVGAPGILRALRVRIRPWGRGRSRVC
jgi:hypothetical protein